MKRKLSRLIPLSLAFVLLLSFSSVSAVDIFSFQNKNFEYSDCCSAEAEKEDSMGIGALYIKKYNGTDEEVTISVLEDPKYPIDGIWDEAFAGNTYIKKISMGINVRCIGVRTFADCTALEEFTVFDQNYLNSSRQRIINYIIKDYAFENCTNLKTCFLAYNAESIGTGAFAGCKNLTKIEIPATVTEIGENVFEGCDKLTVYGEPGSYAETYAKQNSIPFKDAKEFDLPISEPNENKNPKPIVKPAKIKAPARVKKLTAEKKGRKITLTIKKSASKNKTYIEYRKNKGKFKKLTITAKTKFTKKFKKGKYQFRAYSYIKAGKKAYKSKKYRTVKVTVK